MNNDTRRFRFDGGAGTYFGTFILAFLVTLLSFGIFYPYALVLFQRWKAKHSLIDGRRLRFNGSALSLWAHWILWWFLCFITFGIYSWWVVPRVIRWVWENTDFEPAEVVPPQGARRFDPSPQY